MGTTIRRNPVTTAIPSYSSSSIKYQTITNFKGLSVSDNPFIQDPESCSEALNVYVDDNNSLTVRPRVASTDNKLVFSETATCLAAFSIIGGWFTIEYDPTDSVTYARITTNNGENYAVTSFVGATKQITEPNRLYSVYEDGDLINDNGTLYFLDGERLKRIERSGDAFYWAHAGENVYSTPSGLLTLKEQYAPLVKTRYDPETETYSTFQSYNVLNSRYRVGYKAYDDMTQFPLASLIGKKATIVSFNGERYQTDLLDEGELFTNFTSFEKKFFAITGSSDASIIYAVDASTSSVMYSTNYGKTFRPYYYKPVGSETLTSLKATKITCNADGSSLYAIVFGSGILKNFINNVEVETNVSLLATTYTSGSNTYSLVTQDVVLKTNAAGDILSICGHATTKNDDDTTSKVSIALFYKENLKTLYDNVYVTSSDDISKTHITTECVFGDDCILLRVPDPFGGLVYGCSVHVFDPKLTKLYKTITDRDAMTMYYYKGSIILFQNVAAVSSKIGGLPFYVYYILNGTVVQALNITMVLPSLVSADVKSLRLIPTVKGLGCLFGTDTESKIYFMDLNYTTGANNQRTYIYTAVGTNDGKAAKLLPNKDVLIEVNDGGHQLLISDPQTLVADTGLVYCLDKTTRELVSNNSYSSDSDWLIIEYDDHERVYPGVENALFYKFFDQRLWLGGYKNYIIHSGIDENGQPRLDYFPEDGVFKVGNDTTPENAVTDFTGFNIISDDILAAYKRDRLYLFTQTTLDGDTPVVTYTYTEVKAEQGNEAIGQPINAPLTSLPFQINRDGVFALTSLTNVYTADKVATLYSQSVNVKFNVEDLTVLKTVKHRYWAFFVFPYETNTHIYVYDDRYSNWFYWEIPMKIVSLYSDDELMLIGTDGVLRAFKTTDIIQNYNATDNVSSIETTYYDVTPTDTQKLIPWYWVSQILPLGTISYNKHVSKTTFILADSDVTDGYAFNYSIKAWRKSTPLAKSSEASGMVYSVQSVTKRTNFNKINFAQITLTNIDLTNNSLVLRNYDDYVSSIDVSNQKIKLIGLSMKYRIMEV